MTVLLSFKEKTNDARACAKSGHCPFNIGRAPSGGSDNFNLPEFTYDCLKVLNGFIHIIANMAKEAILETSSDFYAVPAETESAILTLWSANHILPPLWNVYTFQVPVYPGF